MRAPVERGCEFAVDEIPFVLGWGHGGWQGWPLGQHFEPMVGGRVAFVYLLLACHRESAQPLTFVAGNRAEVGTLGLPCV